MGRYLLGIVIGLVLVPIRSLLLFQIWQPAGRGER